MMISCHSQCVKFFPDLHDLYLPIEQCYAHGFASRRMALSFQTKDEALDVVASLFAAEVVQIRFLWRYFS